MTEFSMQKKPDGVAIITWDTPSASMNVLSVDGPSKLNDLIDSALIDDNVKGIVLTSGKERSFAGGMDLNVLLNIREKFGNNPESGLFDFAMSLHKLMRKIEIAGRNLKTGEGGKPIACAMPGTGVGIGLEFPLCTHRIFVADHPNAKYGLPEIKVGLFPGAGGTTRLIRKLGLMKAAPFLLEGKLVGPVEAQNAGLIDEITSDPVAAAIDWVLSASPASLVKPWDQKNFKIPGGAPYHPTGFPTFVGAVAMLNGRTKGVFPAAKALMQVIYEGAIVDFDTALKIEARWFVNLLMNPSSQAMIRSLFVNKTAIEKGSARPINISRLPVKKVGIIGAGMMGAGIALVSAQAGIDVILLDRDQATADRGKAYSDAYFAKRIDKRIMTAQKRTNILKSISATSDLAHLKTCDLIIEAVFEDPEIKKEMIKKVEEVIPDDCIVASNTSTLPISDLAKASKKPEQFIGIHFFSPVERMSLVEVIKGKNTDERTIARALDYTRQIKKTPIVVNDARFFYANRCIIPYINESLILAGEGVNLALIDHAAQMLGFPIGPIQLVDETSLDLGAQIAKITMESLGDAYVKTLADDVMFWMVEAGRLGRKAKAGFFDYSKHGERLGYWHGFRSKFPLLKNQPNLKEVQNRLIFVQALEAVRALEQNVISDIREGDIGAIFGWGFPAWSGGPFSWFDIVGLTWAVNKSEKLHDKFGERFSCPKLLLDLQTKNDTFYHQSKK
ncbi:MAG: 3-hydroxyacyl-CoA dehydrogenase NAD-binding domain-containing protein [Aestuariivita sp.]|nr:3-hydroxyacyl-CoA dehydrogenase NAD-binding domain-containing protein [Aestuariivita sp.]